MACYIKLGESIQNDDLVEVPTEGDGALLLSTVAAQFPGAVGVRFKSPTGAWRGLRISGNRIDPPVDGWAGKNYYVVKQAPKRSADTTSTATTEKLSRETEGDDGEVAFLEKYHVPDLMIANLDRHAKDEEIREYFEHFGVLDQFNIKRTDTGEMRGFGFIKYKTSAATKAVLNMDHFIHNRHIDVRYTKRALEMLQMGYGLECMPNDNIPTKLFVGRMPLHTTREHIQTVFNKFAPIRDIYIPPNANGRFAFVTFNSVASAFRAMNEVHQINGQYLQLSTANSYTKQKDKEKQQKQQQQGNNASNGPNNQSNQTNNAVNANSNTNDTEMMETDQNDRASMKVQTADAKNFKMSSYLMNNMNNMGGQNKMGKQNMQTSSNNNNNTNNQGNQGNFNSNYGNNNYGGGYGGGYGNGGYGHQGGYGGQGGYNSGVYGHTGYGNGTNYNGNYTSFGNPVWGKPKP